MTEDTAQTLNTNDLWFWVTELQAGRPNAAEAVFRKIVAKVELFARGMFQKFPRVGRFVDVDDVIQSSLIRLLAAMRTARPNNRQHFYALVSEQIRRELLDLIKHYYGPRGEGTNVAGVSLGEGEGEHTPVAPEAECELDQAGAFHKAVADLPTEEREVIGLTYYHGWTQEAIANLFQVSTRTVQRWLDSATSRLRERMVRLDPSLPAMPVTIPQRQ